jgi:hypothetical protein
MSEKGRTPEETISRLGIKPVMSLRNPKSEARPDERFQAMTEKNGDGQTPEQLFALATCALGGLENVICTSAEAFDDSGKKVSLGNFFVSL